MESLTPTILFLFGALGASAGFMAGLLGIGGGVILVPLFLWALPLVGFPSEHLAHIAFGTSLAIIFPTAISSTFGHRKRGNVAWHEVFPLAAGSLLGALLGATIAVSLSASTLKALFGLMQILIGLKLLFFHPHLPEDVRPNPGRTALVVVGLVSGAFSAFFGVGGGVIAVPLMVLALRMPIHYAVGNSSAMIVVASLMGTLSYAFHGMSIPGLPAYQAGFVNYAVAFGVAPFSIVCARLGVRVANRLHHKQLTRVFAVLLIVIGVRLFVRLFL